MNYHKILDLIVDPQSKVKISFDGKNFISKNNEFIINDEILNMFQNDEKTDEITKKQKKFYEDVMFPNYDDLDDFSSLIKKSEGSMFAKKLDEELPYSSKIIEIGCGTGQLSNFLSRYNRTIIGTDLSLNSLKLANNFRKANSIKNVFFLQMNLFKPCFNDGTFDAVISNGCLHHTSDPRRAFNKVAKLAKKSGLIIIGLYHKNGRLFTNFRQNFFKIFDNKFKFLDPRNIDENLSKSKKYAWYRDQYQNPKEFSYKFNEILEWFEENNVKYLSSIPFHGFDKNFQLFGDHKRPSKLKIFIKELLMTFDIDQIKEGGFFIMVGKKY
jgi:SAM-dependent methyltransferase